MGLHAQWGRQAVGPMVQPVAVHSIPGRGFSRQACHVPVHALQLPAFWSPASVSSKMDPQPVPLL